MKAPSRLDTVCGVIMGQAPSGEAYNSERKGWPLIAGASDFGDVYPDAKKFTTQASKLSQRGDIILGIRATIGEKVLSDGEYCLGRGVAGLRAHSILDSRYLWHWLTHVRPQLTGKAKGATFKQVNREDIGELEIVLPPLAEQRRIAAILDAAEALREKRRQSLAKLDILTQSIFIEMFGDPGVNPKMWVQKPIVEIGRIITGNTPSRAKPEYYGDEIEWIKSDNLNTPQHYITKAEERLSKEGKLVARTVPAGSILVTCIAGSPSCIGNAAITDREVAFNQQINALVPKQADFRFIFAHIVVGKRLIQEASTAGMKGMVSKSRFEKIRLMYPPLDLQRTFAAVFDKIEDLKTAQRSSLAKLDALFASLQHRAFRGEL